MGDKYVQTTISENLHHRLKWLAFKRGIKIRAALREAIEAYVSEIPPNTDLTKPPEVSV